MYTNFRKLKSKSAKQRAQYSYSLAFAIGIRNVGIRKTPRQGRKGWHIVENAYVVAVHKATSSKDSAWEESNSPGLYM